MISQINSSAPRSVYPTKAQEAKQSNNLLKQGELSKTQQLKESIDSGSYKVNIQAISEKMADALL